jgi:hypothetical protein
VRYGEYHCSNRPASYQPMIGLGLGIPSLIILCGHVWPNIKQRDLDLQTRLKARPSHSSTLKPSLIISPRPTMTRLTIFPLVLLAVSSISPFFTTITATSHATTVRAISESKYSNAHSLGDTYNFDPRDGWQNVNITDLHYKYRRDSSFDSGIFNGEQGLDFEKRTSSKPPSKNSTKAVPMSIGGTVKGVVESVWKGLKGLGKSQAVTITWSVSGRPPSISSPVAPVYAHNNIYRFFQVHRPRPSKPELLVKDWLGSYGSSSLSRFTQLYTR